MKTLLDVIAEKEALAKSIHEELEALQREKELQMQSLAQEIEALRVAAKIVSESDHPGPVAAKGAHEHLPAASVPAAAAPAKKLWP
jgi:hypothetical protein